MGAHMLVNLLVLLAKVLYCKWVLREKWQKRKEKSCFRKLPYKAKNVNVNVNVKAILDNIE